MRCSTSSIRLRCIAYKKDATTESMATVVSASPPRFLPRHSEADLLDAFFLLFLDS
jgi:hypothetical protein